MDCEHLRMVIVLGHIKCTLCGEILDTDGKEQDWEHSLRLRKSRDIRRKKAIRNARRRRFRHG